MMRKLILISIAALALPALLAPAGAGASLRAVAQPSQQAKAQRYTVVLAGGREDNTIRIWLSSDGRELVIDSVVPLEVGAVCVNPPNDPNELTCRAPLIAGFEVNAGGGEDRVAVARNVGLPVTLRGGAGDDTLVGGAGDDKILGGAGEDRLGGWRGDDLLHGGPDDDQVLGGPGDDTLRGGAGDDFLWGGPGVDDVRQFRGLRGRARG